MIVGWKFSFTLPRAIYDAIRAIECHQKNDDLMILMHEFSDRGGSKVSPRTLPEAGGCVRLRSPGRLQNSSRTVGVAARSPGYWNYCDELRIQLCL